MRKKTKKAIIIYGLPGSGKGTQAQRLEKILKGYHFDTGREIEKTVHDPKSQKDPEIRREKELFDKGKLCDPKWVAELVKNSIKKLARKNKTLIFSGSPRTLFEAKQIMPLLIKLYPKKNLYIFDLKISSKTSIFRNSHRKICSQCGYPIIYSKETEDWRYCPKCGAPLIIRTLDKPEIIKIRIKEYLKRTRPLKNYFKKLKLKIYEIDGEPLPDLVTKQILEKLK